MNPELTFTAFVLLHWMIALALAPLLPGVIAKVKAVFAGKAGPSLFQPYRDLEKLLSKKCIYSRSATWVFRAAPLIVLAAMLTIVLMLPLGPFPAPIRFSGDVILVVYLMALARFFMISASLDTASSFSGMGGAREAFFACLAELAIFMTLATLGLVARSLSLSGMIGYDALVSWSAVGPALLLSVAGLFIVLLAENSRIPVDDPDTHLELTMIHEVMILDAAGIDLAFLNWAAAIKLFFFSAMLVTILFPIPTGNVLKDAGVFLVGLIGIAVVVGIVESAMARLRLNRVPHLLLTAFTLAFFGFVVTLWRM